MKISLILSLKPNNKNLLNSISINYNYSNSPIMKLFNYSDSNKIYTIHYNTYIYSKLNNSMSILLPIFNIINSQNHINNSCLMEEFSHSINSIHYYLNRMQNRLSSNSLLSFNLLSIIYLLIDIQILFTIPIMISIYKCLKMLSYI